MRFWRGFGIGRIWAILLLLLVTGSAQATILKIETFEDQSWSDNFNTCTAPGVPTGCSPSLHRWTSTGGAFNSGQISSAQKRNGTYALRLEARSYDPPLKSDYNSTYPNRAEVRSPGLYAFTGVERWYGFSVMLDNAFGDTSNDNQGTIIHQIHGSHPDCNSTGSPPFSIQVFPNLNVDIVTIHDVTCTGSSYVITRRPIAPMVKGVWYDYVIHGKWRVDSTGILQVWRRQAGQAWGAPVVDETGPNTKNSTSLTNWRMSIYKFWWGTGTSSDSSVVGSAKRPASDELIVWFDEVRIGDASSSLAEVSPVEPTGDTVPPAPPTSPQITSPYPGHLQFTWTAPTTDTGGGGLTGLGSYVVQRCVTETCTFAQAEIVSHPTALHLSTGLTPGVEYSFRVQACDNDPAGQCSAFTTPIALASASGAPIAHWDGSVSGSTVLDVENTGTDYDGTITGTVTQITGAIGANALHFAGTADYVTVLDAPALDFIATQDFTWAAWVRSSQTPALDLWPILYEKVPVDGSGFANAPGLEIGLHDSNVTVGGVVGRWYATIWKDIDEWQIAYGCTNIADGAWHHLSVRRQGTTLQTFQDGLPCAGTTLDTVTHADVGLSLSNAVNVRMGAWPVGTGGDFTGDLDEIKLYNYARTDQEIATDASPGATFAARHFRLHAPDQAIGTQWLAAEDTGRLVRGDGQWRVRYQLHNTSVATGNLSIALQCRLSPELYGITVNSLVPAYLFDPDSGLNAACTAAKVCLHADAVVADGTSSPTGQLTAGGKTYAGGRVVTSPTWPTVSLGADTIGEVEFHVKTINLPEQSIVCCRPATSDASPLADYSGMPSGEACVTTYHGSAALFGG